MDIFRYRTSEEAGAQAGKQTAVLVKRQKNTPVLLLLSGGSALGLVDTIDPLILGARVTVGMLDERYSRDPSVNNFAQLVHHSFYEEGQKRGARFLDTRVRVTHMSDEEVPETFEELTKRFENSLRAWKEQNPAGRVIVTQGIGEDGHTAGIMPYPLQRETFEALFENEAKWVVGYNVKEEAKKTGDTVLKVKKERLRKSPRNLHPFAGDVMAFRGNSPLFGGSDPLVGAVKVLWSSRLSSAGGVYPLRVTATCPFLRGVVDDAIVYVVGRNKRAVLERVLWEKTRVWEIPARIIHQMKSVFLFTDIS